MSLKTERPLGYGRSERIEPMSAKWYVEHPFDEPGTWITSGNGGSVVASMQDRDGTPFDDAAKNAARIVEAVNGYPKACAARDRYLVALRCLLSLDYYPHGGADCDADCGVCFALADARAAVEGAP